MDKSEHLATIVIQAAQVFLEKRMAPIVEGVAALKRDAGAFLTRDDAVKMLPDVDGVARLVDLMAGEIKELRAELASRPNIETVRAEQANAAKQAAAELFATLPTPKDGKSVTVDEVRPLLDQMVAAIPVPKDGKDAEPVDYARIAEQVDASVAIAMRMIPDPKDGNDAVVDYDRIGKAIEEVVAALPVPKDGAAGKDGRDGVDGKDGVDGERGTDGVNGKDGIDGLRGEDGARGKDGSDGISGRDGIDGKDGGNGIDGRSGADGIDGKDGAPGKDADFALVKDMVQMSLEAAVAKMRVPEDGKPGRDADPVDMDAVARMVNGEVVKTLATWPRPADGKDGLGFDDFSMDLKDDGRTIVHRFARGEQSRSYEIVVPWQIYRGVYVKGMRATRGDSVTYGGSQFTAKCDTDKPPGTDDWVLSVKRGKDAAGET